FEDLYSSTISLPAESAVKSQTNKPPISPAVGKSYCLPRCFWLTKVILNSSASPAKIRSQACLKVFASWDITVSSIANAEVPFLKAFFLFSSSLSDYHQLGAGNQFCGVFPHEA
ncbi:hypothetical protein N665_0532s0029, partial [Sinapis alba]